MGLAHAEDSAELAKKALNPIAAMYSLPIQYTRDQKMGPTGAGMHSVTNIQPVLPFELNSEWNLISRNGRILGGGPAILIPTGSDSLLSSRQWGLGPTVVALKQSCDWTRGILANHIWSLNGEGANGAKKVNQTFLQPFLSYTTATYTTFGANTDDCSVCAI